MQVVVKLQKAIRYNFFYIQARERGGKEEVKERQREKQTMTEINR